MQAGRVIIAYTDYKSPYAYLAKDPARDLAKSCDARLEWRPYILDVPSYLGSARVDAQGNVEAANRNAHQWRRVRYSYMDCRRQANKRGLIIRGTRKIWDSRLAAAAMLHTQKAGEDIFNRYHDSVFERFWQRDLDIEDLTTIAREVAKAGADPETFQSNHQTLVAEVESISHMAEATGVFGVPTFVINNEIFWGSEHIADIKAMFTPGRSR